MYIKSLHLKLKFKTKIFIILLYYYAGYRKTYMGKPTVFCFFATYHLLEIVITTKFSFIMYLAEITRAFLALTNFRGVGCITLLCIEVS